MVNEKKQNRMQSSSGFTKEEELLLQDFSRNVSTKSSAIFYGNAFIVSATPICKSQTLLRSPWFNEVFPSQMMLVACLRLGLFWRIHNMDLLSSGVFFLVMTGLSTYLMAMAYKNIKYQIKYKIAVRREDAVMREVNRQLGEDKKVTRKEKDERILWKKNEVADYEATTFSIFYNNALYLAIIIFISFFLLKNSSPFINYIFSIGFASGALALFSTSTQANWIDQHETRFFHWPHYLQINNYTNIL